MDIFWTLHNFMIWLPISNNFWSILCWHHFESDPPDRCSSHPISWRPSAGAFVGHPPPQQFLQSSFWMLAADVISKNLGGFLDEPSKHWCFSTVKIMWYFQIFSDSDLSFCFLIPICHAVIGKTLILLLNPWCDDALDHKITLRSEK